MIDYTWNNDISGDWSDANNWSPSGGPPTASDIATISGTATTEIDVSTADTASSLTLSNANATLNDDGASASLTIGGTLTMSNGTINIDPSSNPKGGSLLTVGALDFSGGAITIDANASNSNPGGQLHLNGTLRQTGGTLTLRAGTPRGSGTISGGAIDSTGGTIVFGGGILSGVTFDGPLNLTASDDSVQLANGTTIVGSSGSGSGTINDTGDGSSLHFDNTQTVSNTTINLGNTNNIPYLYEDDTTGVGGQVLTLASSVLVNVTGNAAITSSGGNGGNGINNDGVINVAGSLAINVDVLSFFTNEGTINIEGGSVGISQTFTNLSANTLTGGTYEVQTSSTLLINSNDTIATDDADIILSGVASKIETRNPITGVTNRIETTLTTIGSSGELQLDNSRNYTTRLALTNDGIIEHGTGTSVVSPNIRNEGTILVSSGKLELKGTVTGTGTDTISGSSKLQFDAGVSTKGTINHQDIDLAGSGGTLALLEPTRFYGEISDFGPSDTVKLEGSWAFSALSQSAGFTQLTLHRGLTTHAFDFVGDYSRSGFQIQSGKISTITFV
jgi:hypothetical protein